MLILKRQDHYHGAFVIQPLYGDDDTYGTYRVCHLIGLIEKLLALDVMWVH